MKKIIPFVFNVLMPVLILGILYMLVGDMSSYYNSLIKMFDIDFVLIISLWFCFTGILGYASYLADNSADMYCYRLLVLMNFLNMVWLVIFFVFHQLLISIIWELVILGVLVWNSKRIKNSEMRAFWIVMLYVVFVVFILILNISIYIAMK